ncbi:phosphoenolpyruvate carboxykinase (ATP) [Chloroflexota bacterium]
MTTNKMGMPSNFDLDQHGFRNLNMEYWTLTTGSLMERIVARREGVLAHEGSIVVRTGSHTGRSPNDKFVVYDPETEDTVFWGNINSPMNQICFERLYMHMRSYFQGRDVFVQDTTVVAHPDYRMPIRVITETAWHNLFARNLFIRLKPEEIPGHIPEYTVIHAPGFQANPEEDGTNSEVFVVINYEKKLVLIGGSSYAGEIKKSIFSVLNYLLPQEGVLPMHCSANVGENGDSALFFGLSGTGKTTLSSVPDRRLIGDDEHGWGDDGIFNFEGGCYAKTIDLREELEPSIWKACHHFGTILENVNIDAYTRRVDFDDGSLTENTRAAYPIGFLDNTTSDGVGEHPENVFFLTADAFGVLPPIARLNTEQAMFYFITGYTSKLGGTEKGVTEPLATFSTCFGAPFLPLNPTIYTKLLGEKITKHNTRVWLINTGWTGGPYGEGSRIRLPYTRAMIRAALNGSLDKVDYRTDANFGIDVPTMVPDVPSEMLNPRLTWSDGEKYDRKAQELAALFEQNHALFMEDKLSDQDVPEPCE